MAQVPMQQTPSVPMSTQGPGEIQVNTKVEPVKNYMPEQAQQMGQAMQRTGSAVTEIGLRMQDQRDDANSKNLFNQFSDEMAKLQSDYSQLRGKDAVTSFEQINNQIADRVKYYEGLAENDMQRYMFTQKAAVLRRSATGAIVNHSITEQRNFDNQETEAQANGFVRGAVASWDTYTDPEGNFAVNYAAALKTWDEYADKNGIPKDSAQYREGQIKIGNGVHSGVMDGLIQGNRYVDAKDYLDTQFQRGRIDRATYKTYSQQIQTGFRKEQGIDAANRIYEGIGGAATGNDFESIVTTTLAFEGGYVADDGGAGPTKYGINQEANPDVDVANLTPEDAKAIYKKRYWDAIKADDLDPAIRAIAFDTAVNMGVDTAKEMIAASNGDFDKFIQMRREKYMSLVLGNPDKYGKFEKGWMNRLNTIQEQHDATAGYTNFDAEPGATGRAGQPSLAQMLKTVRATITDPDERAYAESLIKDKYNEAVALQEENYKAAYEQAIAIAWDTPGASWKDLSPAMMAALKREDLNKIIEGPPRADVPDTVIHILNNPTEMLPGNIEKYRSELTESTYKGFVAQGVTAKSSPETILEASIDSEIWNGLLLQNGLDNLANPKKGSDDAIKAASLRLDYQRQIDYEQQRLKKKLSLSEKETLLINMLNNKVWVDRLGPDEQVSIYAVSQEDLDNTYIKYGGSGNSAVKSGTEIKLSSIPAAQLTAIQEAMIANGVRFTYQGAIDMWVDQGFPGRPDIAQQLQTLR